MKKVKEIEVKTFYKEIDGDVWMFRKIGDLPWEGILTPYKETPYVHVERTKHG